MLFLETKGNTVRGMHYGRYRSGDLRGTVDGDTVRFRSVFPIEGSRIDYSFSGRLTRDSMSGELDCGEHGVAKWSAVRHSAAGVTRDPSKA
jgi:hypothetical protein